MPREHIIAPRLNLQTNASLRAPALWQGRQPTTFEMLGSLWHTELVDRLDLPSIVLIAIGLSADCFAVALGFSISTKRITVSRTLRVCFAFGCAQAIMPVLGWLGGRTIIDLISDYDHWVAFGLLFFIGARMIWESFRSKEGEHQKRDISKGLPLLTLAVATSIDALAVGLSFAFLSVNIAVAALTIGVVCFLITGVGFVAGSKTGKLMGKRAEVAGGVILIGIGLRILLTHLL